MKFKKINRVDDSEIIAIVSDNQGMTCLRLSERLNVPQGTVKYKLIALSASGRIFRQKRGNLRLLYTSHYAKVNHIPDVYPEKPVKTTLELQHMFHSLIRGSAL